ncbi:hypothetical protein DY240_29850 [Jiangella rhizosphaerae]|uniref:Uncharacterized protein n=2 Tax=Jiangella rhizosphaerae TaxID=2293569 RepID=A0A418KGW0_9ACTN|nr:hypothetical protein DY240_29850 [Jiangella rhizosphaerae]
MNRSAVALAADSASTIATEQGLKVYDSVNKLFELIKGRPVGVMIYNASDIAHRPWETVIKTYREDRCHMQFGTLDEYVNDLLDYMAGQRKLFSEDQQGSAFLLNCLRTSTELRSRIDFVIRGGFARRTDLTEGRIRRIVKAQIDAFKAQVDEWAPGPWADQLNERRLRQQHGSTIDSAINAVFQKLPMSDGTRTALKLALLRRFLRYDDGDTNYSGVVIAGFGQDEFYPKLREFRVKGLINDVLMAKDGAREDIDFTRPAYVDSFAQGDMVRSFTVGIQDRVRGEMIHFWEEWLSKAESRAEEMVSRVLPQLEDSEAKQLGAALGSLTSQGFSDFLSHMQGFENREVKGELLQSLAHLPKDEMGAMAESLVNLTTLKRRVSLRDAQTVGGAVDVAVVSRGDGFVWLKRKHYFDRTLNPTWAALHAGRSPKTEAVNQDG